MTNYSEFIRDLLIGKYWVNYGRCCDLIRIDFDDKRGNSNASNYALHIQCAMRMILSNQVVLSSENMYIPDSDVPDEQNPFHWDEPGRSRFDKQISAIFSEHQGAQIQEVILSECGDVSILLENHLAIHIYINSTDGEDEEWCLIHFIDANRSEHLIRSPYEYEYHDLDFAALFQVGMERLQYQKPIL